MSDKFEQWCIVEIMGHQTYAGLVTEQVLGGASFVRVDVPESEGIPAFSKCFGAASIYCITPVTEEIARLRAKSLRQAPLSVYDLPSEIRDRIRTPAMPALTGRHIPAEDDGDGWDHTDDDDENQP